MQVGSRPRWGCRGARGVGLIGRGILDAEYWVCRVAIVHVGKAHRAVKQAVAIDQTLAAYRYYFLCNHLRLQAISTLQVVYWLSRPHGCLIVH